MTSATRPRRRRSTLEALTATDARRIALAAQGFDRPRPVAGARTADVRRTLERLRLVQIDSVNVLVRAHYMPLFSRLGAYERGALDDLVYGKRTWFEHWGHEASFLPVRYFPWLRWRMERHPWGGVERAAREAPTLVDDLLRRVAAEGPLAASDLDSAPRTKGMWAWTRGKMVLEWLLATGRLAVACRRGFERCYDLTERVVPKEVLDLPAPSPDEALESLLVESAEALGIGTATDLADYFRLRPVRARPRVAALVEAGRLREIRVDGWREPAYVPARARIEPRPVPAAALVSPFDSLVFDRRRIERMFGFHYRIEIYVPAAKRRHGYYVLPFLMDEALRARVDLKADRAAGRLLVRAAHLEPGEAAGPVAERLAPELVRLAGWLGLDRVVVERRGDLHRPLRSALAGAQRSGGA
ncbi:MAG TPA: crosslink repair DNA glycosylase YcaQ family protein [Planctomycetota bacterium]|nr:crosslink repair DNA glycosylase YcaQ family protein [Planctomycetota bacterium]